MKILFAGSKVPFSSDRSAYHNRLRVAKRTSWIAKAGGTLFVVALMVLSSITANAATPQKKRLTLLQQGQNYYRGKTITFIAPTSAGAGNDINSRAVAQSLGVALDATVNVEDIPSGSGIAGANDIAASSKNGLTIGYISPGTQYYDVITNTQGYNFNPERLSFLGGIVGGFDFIATQTSSPYTSFASLLKTTPADPVTFIGQQTQGILDAEVIMASFGIDTKYITGYSTSASLLQGFLRGDGALAYETFPNISADVNSGIVRPLLVTDVDMALPTSYPNYAQLSVYPTIGKLEKEYPAKTRKEADARKYVTFFANILSFTAVAPTKTPPAEVRALQWAMKQAIKSNHVKATLTFEGLPTGFVPPGILKANYVAALKDLSALSQLLGY